MGILKNGWWREKNKINCSFIPKEKEVTGGKEIKFTHLKRKGSWEKGKEIVHLFQKRKNLETKKESKGKLYPPQICKWKRIEKDKKKRKLSPLAKEKEVGRKYYLLTIYFFQKVSKRFVKKTKIHVKINKLTTRIHWAKVQRKRKHK